MWPRSHLLTFPALLAASAVMACGRDTPPLAPASPLYSQAQRVGNLFPFEDPSGTVATLSTTGSLDAGNPFFQSLGTNGRSCGSCHLASDALPVPANAQFTVAAVHDPYGCALVVDQGIATASMYRRPLPTTNLSFLSAVMFDGRETLAPLNNEQTMQANLRSDLAHQAADATLGHAQAAAAATAAQLSQMVDFELALFSAQVRDDSAGMLDAQGASGGPLTLSAQSFYPGINDPLGGNPTGAAFDPNAFTIFSRWLNLHSSERDQYTTAREAVVSGEIL